MKKSPFLAATVALLLGAFSCVASAQGYPERPIRLIVPVAAGNGTDALARLFGMEMFKMLKQPVVVENKPGAGGEIAAAEVARANPDGYTLLFANTSIFTANKWMYPKSHDQDLVPIIHLTETTLVLLSGPGFGGKSLSEVLALARSSKKPVDIGTASSVYAIAAGLLREAGGVNLMMVPYRASAQALVDLNRDEIQLMFESFNTGAALVSTGRVDALGVTSAKRQKSLPNVPTMKESGLDFTFGAWTILAAPKGTPANIVQKLNQSMNAVLRSPEFRQQLAALGTEAVGGTPEDVGRSVQQESRRLGAIITKFNLKP